MRLPHLHWARDTSRIGCYLHHRCRCGQRRITRHDGHGDAVWSSPWGTVAQTLAAVIDAPDSP